MNSELQKYRKEYINLHLEQVLDYEKFTIFSTIYHSVKIEGCSLSETDTKILLDKDITAKGKPLSDHLMVKDHYNAFMFLKDKAALKTKLSVELIKETQSILMKNTGTLVSSVAGNFDTSKGDLRLAQVYVDKKYFPDYKKVPELLSNLIANINTKLEKNLDDDEVLYLASDAHYNLVNIHPFADGNGRLSRLFMNYILMYFNQPFVKIFTEDRLEYIDALNETEEKEDLKIFRDFTSSQQIKFFKNEIDKFQSSKKGFNLMF